MTIAFNSNHRRLIIRSAPAAALALQWPLLGASTAHALDLSAITATQASQGLRAALEKGAQAAVAALGVEGGFLNNPQVRIALPDGLRKLESLLRGLGRGPDLDALTASMNRAAELAVPQARSLLSQAIKSMSVQDAKSIISGGDESVTQFFREKTVKPLTERFLPIVTATVSRIGLAQRYNDLAGQAARFGLVDEKSSSVQRYVTGKSLDGLYFMIAQQERAIRADPVKAGSDILRKVFGGGR